MVPLRKQNFSSIRLQRSPALNRLNFSPSDLRPRSVILHTCAQEGEHFSGKTLFSQTPQEGTSRPAGAAGCKGSTAHGSRVSPLSGLLKAVRAKREQSIQVPNAKGLFGTNFLNQQSPNRSLTSVCATQLLRFQSRATLLNLSS